MDDKNELLALTKAIPIVTDTNIQKWRDVFYAGKQTKTNKEIIDDLSRTLDDSLKKRACCLRSVNIDDPSKYNVSVRLPIPYSAKIEKMDPRNVKYEFIDINTTVPSSDCSKLKDHNGKNATFDRGSKACDVFYETYCHNAAVDYEEKAKRLGIKPSARDFANFHKTECSCYNAYLPLPPYTNLSRRCLRFPKCSKEEEKDGNVYIDPMSRNKCPENLTICTQLVDFSNTSAGKDINSELFLMNNCGNDGKTTVANNGGGDNKLLIYIAIGLLLCMMLMFSSHMAITNI